MQSLRLQLLHADDVQDEVQQSLIQFESLKARFSGRLDFCLLTELADLKDQTDLQNLAETASNTDFLIIIIWNQASSLFQEQVGAVLEAINFDDVEIKLFVKEAKVAVDLSDRVALLDQLEQREELELFLEHTLTDVLPTSFNTTHDFAQAFSDWLDQVANQRLVTDGKNGKVTSFWPQLSSTYLERPRLLELLPDSTGYVVWLEAPYGYGKSILAAQWAKSLEENWRVIWISAKSGDVQTLLAESFNLTPPVPWSLLRDYLWQEPTLLVIEDLNDDDLTELLKNVQGLILLASRGLLNAEVMEMLQANEQLIHIQPDTLAFNEEETQQLFGDSHKGSLVWQQTQGWSLPLHFSFLTGELPAAEKMVDGIKSSLREEAWQEILFLSALSSVPESSANDITRELATANFVQTLEGVYRVHPLAAETLVQDYRVDIQKLVLAQRDRLEVRYFADALFNCQLWRELNELMTEEYTLSRSVPESCVKWHETLLEHYEEQSFNPQYLINLSWAYGSLGDIEQSVTKLENVVNHPQARADEIVTSCGYAIYDLDSHTSKSLIRWFEEKAFSQLENIEADTAKLFLSILAIHYADISDFEESERLHLKAKAYQSKDVYHNIIVDINLHNTLWDAKGLLSSYLEHIHRFLSHSQEASFLINFSNSYWFLGKIAQYTGNNQQAKVFFQKGQAWGEYNKLFEIICNAELASLDLDAEAFPNLVLQIELLDQPRFLNYLVSLWAQTLRMLDRPKEHILEILNKSKGIHAELERLAVNHKTVEHETVEHKTEQTLADLPDISTQNMRLLRLPLQAKRYLITKDKTDLCALIEMTEYRERILPGLIPFKHLPKDNVVLSEHYSIKEVLKSEWQEAITHRLDDIPELTLRLFGQITAEFLQENLELTDRQKHILSLLTLGLNREQIAETMWPEAETKKQRNNLNVQLNMLRKVIEPWGVPIYLQEGGLQKVSSDYIKLQHAIHLKDADKVLDLYQEPFAPGIYLEVINDERERLREVVVDVLFTASATVDISSSRRYLLRVTELEPLHEEALTALLKLLIRQGRRREARQRYTKFATQLKDELGLEPLEATTALIQV